MRRGQGSARRPGQSLSGAYGFSTNPRPGT